MAHFVVTYPNKENNHFDFDYYLSTHLPLGNRLLKDYGLTGWEVEKGRPNARGEPPAFICITRLYFGDPEQMNAGFAAHGAELKDDMSNYTNIEPVFTLVETVGNSGK